MAFEDFPRGAGNHDAPQLLGTAAWQFTAPEWQRGAIWLGRDRDGRTVGHLDDRHVITVAGSRSGKGRSTLIPNLLLYPGSCVVNDPKGENATITAAYHVCRHRGCSKNGKSVARDKLHAAYQSMLAAMTPSPEFVRLLDKLFRKRWAEADSKAKEASAALKLEAVAVEKKIGQLMERILESESPTVIAAYERKVEELERQKLLAHEKVSRCGTVAKGYDETFRTAFEFFASPCNLWHNGGFADKRTVLKLTLSEPLVHDWNSGVRTAEFSLPFKLLGNESDREKLMAERVGFEPTIGF